MHSRRFMAHRGVTLLLLFFTGVLVVGLRPRGVQAQERGSDEPRAAFVFAELGVGANITGGVGFATGLTLGVGGRLSPTPFSFYAIGDVAFSASRTEGMRESGAYQHRSQRWDFGLGFRLYLGDLPLYGASPNIRLSLFVDAVVGPSMATSRLDASGIAARESVLDTAAIGFGAGMLLRLTRRFAVGIRAKVTYSLDEITLLNLVDDGDPQAPVQVMLTGRWHL